MMVMPWGDPSSCGGPGGTLKRHRAQGIFLFFACAAISISGQDIEQSRTGSPELHAVSPNYNPPPFQHNPVSPSGSVMFLLSPQGKRMAAGHPERGGPIKSLGVACCSSPP